MSDYTDPDDLARAVDMVAEAMYADDQAELVTTTSPPFWWKVLDARIEDAHVTNCGHFDRPNLHGFVRLTDPSVMRCAACEVEHPRVSDRCECCGTVAELHTVVRQEHLTVMQALVCASCEVVE